MQWPIKIKKRKNGNAVDSNVIIDWYVLLLSKLPNLNPVN